MATEANDSPHLLVKNEAESSQTIVTGCQSNGTVLFDQSNQISPGDKTEFTNLPEDEFEIAVNIEDGPRSAKQYENDENIDEITVIVTESEITFQPENNSLSAFDTSATSEEDSTESGSQTNDESLGSDEVYCRNCGGIISKYTEICTECGVQNAVYEPAPNTATETEKDSQGATTPEIESDTAPSKSSKDTESADTNPEATKRTWSVLLVGIGLTAITTAVPIVGGVFLPFGNILPLVGVLNICGILLILLGVYRIYKY
ncbi:hypothetical protein [Halonotius sp. GCM10025705]|uniref:hypothetical protein n=1 Tax=Halonotius sp. GCM10025705 TaxID=3252678 RepID=UPI003607F05A